MDVSDDVVGVLVAGVTLALVGGLMIWMGLAGRDGRLRRNAFAGIRTAATMSSDEAWRAAHVASAGPTVVAGIGPIVCGVAMTVLVLVTRRAGVPEFVVTLLALGSAAWLAGWVIYGAVLGQRAAKEIGSRDGRRRGR